MSLPPLLLSQKSCTSPIPSFSFIPEKKASITTAAIALPLLKENFIKQVEAAVEALQRQSMEKVVLSNAFRLPYKGDALAVFERLLNITHGAFVYYWSHPETGSWLGATPERFYNWNNNSFPPWRWRVLWPPPKPNGPPKSTSNNWWSMRLWRD